MSAPIQLKTLAETAPHDVKASAAPARPLLRLAGIEKVFSNGVTALTGVDLAIRPGEFVSLLGPSGCGKSTLLKLIAALAAPTAGTIDWPQSSYDAEGAPEPALGFVFQEPTLLPWRTVADNVHLPLMLAGTPKRDARERVAEALALVGLSAFANAHPRQLSGGMKMRVSIARALVTRPKILLMDEPFAALDEITRIKLNDDLLELFSRQGLTVIFVTHSVYEFGLSVEPHRGDEFAAGADQRRHPDRRVLPAQRGVPHVLALQRALPVRLGGAAARDGGG